MQQRRPPFDSVGPVNATTAYDKPRLARRPTGRGSQEGGSTAARARSPLPTAQAALFSHIVLATADCANGAGKP